MTTILEKLKGWFRGTAAGEEPAATPPPGAASDPDRETSTNAQVEGASDEPWSGTD